MSVDTVFFYLIAAWYVIEAISAVSLIAAAITLTIYPYKNTKKIKRVNMIELAQVLFYFLACVRSEDTDGNKQRSIGTRQPRSHAQSNISTFSR